MTAVRQPARAGTTPARTSDDFPMPDDPSIVTTACSAKRVTRSATICSRPTNMA
jgi:hypothetical protein